MKKIIAIAIGMLLIPFTAYGMQTAGDESMDQVTGQSGVAIAIDDVMVHFSASETWYQNNVIDTDNNNEVTSSAAIGMVEEGEELMFVNAVIGDGASGVENTGDYGLFGAYDDLADLYNDATDDTYAHSPSALTIHVSDDLAVMDQLGGDEVAGVQIGLPTVEIHTEGSMAMQLLANATEPAGGEAQSPVGSERGDGDTWSYGTLYSGSETMAVLGGNLEIAPLEAYDEDYANNE